MEALEATAAVKCKSSAGFCATGETSSIQQATSKEGFRQGVPAYCQRVLNQAPFWEEVDYLNWDSEQLKNNFTLGLLVLSSHSDWVRDSDGR